MSQLVFSKLNGRLTYIELSTEFNFTWYLTGNTKLAQYISETYDEEIINLNLTLDKSNKSILNIEYLLSRVSMDPLAFDLATDNEKQMLKGLPHKTLCFVMNYILTNFYKFDKVQLKAFPYLGKDIKGRNPINLILYYKRLGFIISEDETGDYTNLNFDKRQSIKMEGKYEDIIKVCSSTFTIPLDENDVIIQHLKV